MRSSDNSKKNDWSEYYEITKTRPPSKLLVKALTHVVDKGKAIDIGGGALKDTRFEMVFGKIKNSLKEGGIFCGQFFGKNDEWSHNPEMTFHSTDEARDLLKDFEILSFEEVEEDGATANGTPKHWHVYHVIAKK